MLRKLGPASDGAFAPDSAPVRLRVPGGDGRQQQAADGLPTLGAFSAAAVAPYRIAAPHSM